VCFAGKRELARIALATAIAEGFLVLPGRRGPMTGHPRIPAGASGTGSDAAPVGDHAPAQPPAAQLPEQVRVRLDKLARLRAEGVVAYPVGFERTDGCGDVAARYGTLPVDTRTDDQVSVAGRVMGVRDHGGLCFASVRDGCGDVQVLLTVKAGLDRWRAEVDLGDHVGIRGTAGTSATGEVTVFADDWTLTAKCLRPLPNKRQGLADPEARVRQRHLDLIIHPQARRMLHVRGEVVHALRSGLRERRFLEVETPMLQPVHGGANARPFVTHSNAYNLRLHLRIAPELYLKRLCVGGMERVYELGRCFRNEGVSVKHNPEFTMLEAYQAYADYTTMRVLVRELTLQACALALGGTVVTHAGAQCDLAAEWPVVPVHAAVSSALGEPVTPDTPAAALRALADRAGVAYDPRWAAAELLLELYERLVEKRTTTPTFYTDFPVEVSPLTRPHRDDPRLAERWDLVAFGTEIATAYSELIDPVEQRERLTAQSLRAAGHDPEAMQLDEDFLRALEYAMPPTGGLGLGVDRLVMLLTDSSIRETLPFPLVRPTAEAARTG
jgi:lysyl-tRNA synthetase class 2